MKTAPKLRKWDSAEHIKTKEDAALYLKACLEEAGDDAGFIFKAVGNVDSLLDKESVRKLKNAARCKAWREANSEKKKAYDKAWREANPEKRKAWCEANPEKRKAYDKAWCEANSEKRKACYKTWCEANSEKKKAYDKAWREANSEKKKAYHKAWRESLSPGYVSKLLGMEANEVPLDLLELKREQILIIRLNRELKKEMKNV